MTKLIGFWNALNQQVPKNFMVQQTVSETTFKQELQEKLEAIGRLDALLINPPEIVTENNTHLEQDLSDFYVFTGFVPPGKHTLIVYQQGNYYFKNILVDGCKHDVLPVA